MNAFAQPRRRTLALCVMAAAVVLAAMPMAASAHHGHSPRRTPIVLFPAWHFTRLAGDRQEPEGRSRRARAPGRSRTSSSSIRARRSRRSAGTSC